MIFGDEKKIIGRAKKSKKSFNVFTLALHGAT